MLIRKNVNSDVDDEVTKRQYDSEYKYFFKLKFIFKYFFISKHFIYLKQNGHF